MSTFEDVFGRHPDVSWLAPGRVNLIGEHTDYNEGFVLPIALPLGVTAHLAARPDGIIRAATNHEPGAVVEADLAELAPGSTAGWFAYVGGVAWALRRGGHALSGFDVLIDGDLPSGAGLSSSAALECAVGAGLNDLLALGLDRIELIRVAQQAENDYVGVPSGSLDQTASLLCEPGKALFVDCRTLGTRQVAFDLGAADLELLVINTRAPHQLVAGEYAERRADCEAAARLLGLSALRDVAGDSLADALERLPDERLRRRVEHVVTENARVIASVDILESRGDPRALGPLLLESHVSLRDRYEVSCRELDLAVSASMAAGAHGARMTGGGFGGSAIALVDTAVASAVRDRVIKAFADQGLCLPEVFATLPSAGAGPLRDGEPLRWR